MKTAVDKVKKGKGRIVNARFAVMCNHYLYDPDFEANRIREPLGAGPQPFNRATSYHGPLPACFHGGLHSGSSYFENVSHLLALALPAGGNCLTQQRAPRAWQRMTRQWLRPNSR